MLVLLTGIGVGLLGLSAIEMRRSQGELALMEARANARMAMMLALGDLQRLAGPDTRVTATADIAGTADGLRLPAGEMPGNGFSVSGTSKGLASLQDDARRWTGVWHNRDEPQQIFHKSPCVGRLGWLVSGHAPDPSKPPHTERSVRMAGGSRPVSVPWHDLTHGGRCAWWVGDEGVKARLDLTSPLPAGEALDEIAMASPRRGWRLIPGMEAYPHAGTGDEKLLEKIIHPAGLNLLDPSLSCRGLAAIATTHSRGVLSNSLCGGLKRDLTPLAWDNPQNLPDMQSRVIPAEAAPGLGTLRWQALRDFARMRHEMRDGALMVSHGHDKTPGVSPVMEELRMLYGARLVPAMGGNFRAQPCVKIAVRFSNPYTVPLAWKQPLEIEFYNATHPSRIPTRLYSLLSNPPILPRMPSEPALLNRAAFVIPPTTLAPGESAVFTHTTPQLRSLLNSTSRIEVPLGPVDPANAGDFRICLGMDHPSPNKSTENHTIHLQEDQGTSQMDIAIRLQGEAGELRRIERIEINNFHHYQCGWKIPAGTASKFQHPVPIQLHVLGTGLEKGPPPSSAIRFGVDVPVVSAVRSFADFNLRARRFSKPVICFQPPPYSLHMAIDHAVFPSDPPGGLTGPDFIRGLDAELPRRVWLHPPAQLASLAQFQHADLTADDGGLSVGHQPGNAFANSYASPFVRREQVIRKRSDFKMVSFTTFEETRRNYYDISYLLNSALWDDWFVSTLPENGEAAPQNPRLVAVHAADESLPPAARLMIDGVFNINSVDPTAWAALLAGLDGIRHPAENTAGDGALLPRSPGQLRLADGSTNGMDEATLAGFRRLSDAQVHMLAEEIVRQVRLRGPFVSLSHFINRTLVPLAENPELGRSGALQTAIDRSHINEGGLYDSNDGRVRLLADANGTPAADVPGPNPTLWPDSPPDGVWPPFSLDTNPGSLAGIYADREMLTDDALKPEQGHRATGMPGWLTQADVLQVIGPSLATRSDTFTIRACGESSNKPGVAPVRIWCEAVVQRMPDYADSSNRPDATPEELTAINHQFGRAFRIVSFRWLTAQDL